MQKNMTVTENYDTSPEAIKREFDRERAVFGERQFKQVEPGATEYYYEYSNNTFDILPLLKFLQSHEAESVAVHLDVVLGDLVEYYLTNEGTAGKIGSYNALMLRELRNAILKGAGFIDLKP